MKSKIIISGRSVIPQTLGNKTDPYTFLAEFSELKVTDGNGIIAFLTKWGVYVDWFDGNNPVSIVKDLLLKTKGKYQPLINKILLKDETPINITELEELNTALSNIKMVISPEKQDYLPRYNYLPIFYKNGALDTIFSNIERIGHPAEDPIAARIKFLIRPANPKNSEIRMVKLDKHLITTIISNTEYDMINDELYHQWIVEYARPFNLESNHFEYEVLIRIGEPGKTLFYKPSELNAVYRVKSTLDVVMARKIWQIFSNKNSKIRLCLVCGKPTSRPNSKTCSRISCKHDLRKINKRTI